MEMFILILMCIIVSHLFITQPFTRWVTFGLTTYRPLRKVKRYTRKVLRLYKRLMSLRNNLKLLMGMW